MSAEAARASFSRARRIQDELRLNPQYQPLRGKNLALLSPWPAARAPTTTQHAAGELGARVALVRHAQAPQAKRADMVALARTLGRLYDAIDCEALPGGTSGHIARWAGVPVFDGLDSQQHPLRALADLMTLQEDAPAARADPPLSIRYLGDAQASARGRIFAATAAALGLVVLRDGEPGDPKGEDIELDARHALHWPLRAWRGAAIDEGLRARNHCALVQALLLEAIG